MILLEQKPYKILLLFWSLLKLSLFKNSKRSSIFSIKRDNYFWFAANPGMIYFKLSCDYLVFIAEESFGGLRPIKGCCSRSTTWPLIGPLSSASQYTGSSGNFQQAIIFCPRVHIPVIFLHTSFSGSHVLSSYPFSFSKHPTRIYLIDTHAIFPVQCIPQVPRHGH